MGDHVRLVLHVVMVRDTLVMKYEEIAYNPITKILDCYSLMISKARINGTVQQWCKLCREEMATGAVSHNSFRRVCQCIRCE